MICRIATFDKKPQIPDERMQSFRAWMMSQLSQPGIKAHYHVHDPKADKAMSISFWESTEHLAAMKDGNETRGRGAEPRVTLYHGRRAETQTGCNTAKECYPRVESGRKKEATHLFS